MIPLLTAGAMLGFAVTAYALGRLALGWYTETQTLIRCDSCHRYTPKRQIRFYGGDPVCTRCAQELATDRATGAPD